MTRVVGIDFREHHVRLCALRSGYRKLELEALVEELLSAHETPAEALRACMARLPHQNADSLVVCLSGSQVFSHQITLPESARKRLKELLPFELEAVLPVDVDELVLDASIVATDAARVGQELSLLTAAARMDEVAELLGTVSVATGRQAERVGVSSAELAHLSKLAPALASDEPVALLDLGFDSADVCVLEAGKPRMLRSLAGGAQAFPDSAGSVVASLRQTLLSHGAVTGREVSRLVILGEGAQMSGLGEYLATELGVTVESLPTLEFSEMGDEDAVRLAPFARAIGTAMHGIRGKGLDLRQGPLAFERGYEHLKARAPLFAALLGAVLVSFLFSVWAESVALSREREALLASLEEVTRSTFGSATTDPDEAEIELAKARKVRPEDPMRYMDGFGAAVALAEKLPDEMSHDVEEFSFDQGRDLSAGKLKIRGQVDSAEDAQKVAQLLEEHRCIEDSKVTKITQVVNSDRERYVLEAVVECPEDPSAGNSKKSKSGGER